MKSLRIVGLLLWASVYATAGSLLALLVLFLIYLTWIGIVLGICWLLPTVWGILKS